MQTFKDSLKKSSIQFLDIIKPEIIKILKCEFCIVEGVTTEKMALTLDMLAGIDVWSINKKLGMYGIALRTQTGNRDWHTYTIRHIRDSGAKTEYEKRKYAIENNRLYPYLTIQSYVTNTNKLISYAIAKTKDIIKMIDDGNCTENRTGTSQIGQASFFVVDWYEMQKAGYKVIIN